MKLEHLETPALLVDLDIMEANMQAMDRLLEGSGIRLRPHYKSNKCPAIAHMQMAAGAKGITCAKLSEAEDLIFSGIEDVLIANQITDPAKVARLAALAKCCCLSVCVDSAENITDLQNAAALQNATIHCLVEYDIGMNRCGVHTQEAVLALAQQLLSCPNLTFDGIQAYAGNLAHEEDFERRRDGSAAVEVKLKALKAYLEAQGIAVQEISGISTGTVQFHTEDTVYTEAQAGSYLFSDAAYHAVGAPFRNALFVAASVMHCHEGAVVTDAGLKSVSVDQRPPAFLGYETVPVEMSEEHAAIYGDFPQKVGERMLLIPSHCCTTINLYDNLYFVRGDKVVNRVPIVSRGKSR